MAIIYAFNSQTDRFYGKVWRTGPRSVPTVADYAGSLALRDKVLVIHLIRA